MPMPRPAERFAQLVSRASSRYQVYISRINDPYKNLSIEHFLLQNTPVDSTVLFLYVNRPCVVIGRNQNPWLESNLRRLAAPGTLMEWDERGNLIDVPSGPIDIVRRRSGGGTVFHDYGNVNYSVICPTADFTRDKHAEMVVEAIRLDNHPRARVNKRHDIVLDQGELLPSSEWPKPEDMHNSPFAEGPSPLKVSGSAYKLVRNRSLHHGTCLVNSPNLRSISGLLNSTSQPFMMGRGVDSVRSRVGNLYTTGKPTAVHDFQFNVVKAFQKLYNLYAETSQTFRAEMQSHGVQCDRGFVGGYVTDEMVERPEIKKGITELQSLEWTYLQTPQFTLSTHPTHEDSRERPKLTDNLPISTKVFLKSRSGAIDSTAISFALDDDSARAESEHIDERLRGKKIHEINDFRDLISLPESSPEKDKIALNLGDWLNGIFGKTI